MGKLRVDSHAKVVLRFCFCDDAIVGILICLVAGETISVLLIADVFDNSWWQVVCVVCIVCVWDNGAWSWSIVTKLRALMGGMASRFTCVF